MDPLQARYKRALWLSATAAVLLCLTGHASAQLGAIDADAIQAIQPSEDQKKQIDKLIADNVGEAGLGSNEKTKVMAARSNLIEPLLRPGVKVGLGFRLYFSGKLVEALRPLSTKQNDDFANINALVIAGELATEPAADLLGEGAKSASSSVRYQAAAGLERTFAALRYHEPAMPEAAVSALVDRLKKMITEEKDANVVAKLVDAASEAMKVRGQSAGEVMCKALAARANLAGKAPIDQAELQATLRAIAAMRDLIGGRAGIAIQANTHLAAAELAGAVLAHARRTVAANGLAPDAKQPRELYAQNCDAAFTLMDLAGTNLDPAFKMPADPKMGEALRKGDARNDGVFLKGLDDTIAVLKKPPFNLNIKP